MEKKTITGILVESALIIGSILIAMFIDEYREGRKERQDEIVYLKSIRDDLARDTAYFSGRIYDFDLMYDYSDSIINVFEDTQLPRKVPQRFLEKVYDKDSSYVVPFEYTLFSIILPIYFQNCPSYESMKSNGDLKLIRDDKILNTLNRHYSHSKFVDDAANNELKRLTETRRNFIIKSPIHFTFQMDVKTANNYIKLEELSNLTYDTRQVVGFISQLMQRKKKDAGELIEMINNYVKNQAL